MKLRLSIAARDRFFGKAMRRIRPSLEPVFERFSEIQLIHPIHSAILVGITDEYGDEHYEEIKNDDGFYQVLIGCRDTWSSGKISDKDLREAVVLKLKTAVSACPFSEPDREKFLTVFK
jgi:hypothetical protein